MKGLIFLNGDAPSEKVLLAINYADCYVICADGAYSYLSNYTKPNLLLGDFDSLEKIPLDVRIERYPIDKDYTDGHLCILKAFDAGVSEVEIYGAFGGERPDHQFSNYALLALAESMGIKATLKGNFDVVLVSDSFETIALNSIVSIVPYTDSVHIIKTEGLKFDATDMTLNKLHLIGMSNFADGNISVKVEKGSVLVFVQRSCYEDNLS